MFAQLHSQGFPVTVLRTYDDIEDFINAATSATTAVPTTDDRSGEDDPVDGSVHGAGAGQDSDRPHYSGRTISREDSRNRAKARRGKRLERGDN